MIQKNRTIPIDSPMLRVWRKYVKANLRRYREVQLNVEKMKAHLVMSNVAGVSSRNEIVFFWFMASTKI